ncbi:MAG: hypothetical protein ACRD0L_01160, partial [Acidimicrobiales bacterium]
MPERVRLEIKRRMGEADIAAVSTLLHLAAVADDHRPLGEHQWLDLVQGGRTGFAGFVAWEAGHGHPVGYAQVSRGDGGGGDGGGGDGRGGDGRG